ncbi:MAG: putative peptidoglycan glycosyltransferase FtsW [Polyangiales bacterium]
MPRAPIQPTPTPIAPPPVGRSGDADPFLIALVMTVIVWGVVMVYSASHFYALRKYGDGQHFLVRQAVFAVLGCGWMLLVSRIDYRRHRGYAKPALLLCTGLLLATVLGICAPRINGSRRWLVVGPLRMQPSEATKLVLIVWLAHSLAGKVGRMRELAFGVLPHALVASVLAALCVGQKDFGSGSMMIALTGVLLYVAGARARDLLKCAVIALPVSVALVLTNATRMMRIVSAYFDDKPSYQVEHSLAAFASGRFFGVGLGNSAEKIRLPEAHTDFIAAIIAEEHGLIGLATLVLACCAIVQRCQRAARRAPDDFGLYLGTGLAAFLALQFLVNLGMVVGLLPPKGIALPFVSYGGSSMMVNCTVIGLALSISRAGNGGVRRLRPAA